MRKLILSLAVVGSLFGWGGHAMMHGYYGNGMMYGPYGRGNCNITIPTQKYNITQKDIDALKYMYQEEKLARDVYITLAKKWGFIIFQNISNSEQRHMDAVKALLDKYNIPVPLTNDEVGYFKGEFKNLYNELASKGLKSPMLSLLTRDLHQENELILPLFLHPHHLLAFYPICDYYALSMHLTHPV